MAHKIIDDIQNTVLTEIAQAVDGRLVGQIADIMVDRELKKRKDAIVPGIDKHAEWTAALKKLEANPDFRTYDKDGRPVGEPTYSEKKWGEIKKMREQIQKLENAIIKAYTDGELKDVNQILGSGGKDQKPSEPEVSGTPAG